MNKHDFITNRVLEEAAYIIRTKDNIRATAHKFMTSKSTVHKDMRERLIRINPLMYEAVIRILEYNKAERHLRGGEATKRKYSA